MARKLPIEKVPAIGEYHTEQFFSRLNDGSCPLVFLLFKVGQKCRQQADQRQEGTDLDDKEDAGGVGEFAEHSGGDASQAKGNAEEQPGDGADLARKQFGGVNEYRRKRGGEDQAIDDAERNGPKKIRVR